MIVIKLWGGLGNQLFQYAFGYAFAKNYNQQMYFDFDFYIKQASNIDRREIEIKKLNVDEMPIYKRSKLLKALNNKYLGALTRRLPKFFIRIGDGFWYYKEPYHRLVSNLPNKKNIYFDGYWQTSKYFNEFREELLTQFYPKNGLSFEVEKFFEEKTNLNTVAVHIRKGDFDNGKIRKIGNPIPIEYYREAMQFCRKELDNPLFVVFSDNAGWVKENLENSNDICYISDYVKTSSVEDLIGISKCKNGIMSASTFSWWGNWLRKEKGLVVTPKGRFYNNYFYEDDWIQI